MSDALLKCDLKDPLELNLSYMPFIKGGGLFVQTQEVFSLGDRVLVDMTFPGLKEPFHIEGKVVWLIPMNALHHVVQGIGIQFIGVNAKKIKDEIESHLDKKMDIGGYTCGISMDMSEKR